MVAFEGLDGLFLLPEEVVDDALLALLRLAGRNIAYWYQRS
jgi:hypothetical protein